jgi:Ni,Fe-hydrogenase I small subunit
MGPGERTETGESNITHARETAATTPRLDPGGAMRPVINIMGCPAQRLEPGH